MCRILVSTLVFLLLGCGRSGSGSGAGSRSGESATGDSPPHISSNGNEPGADLGSASPGGSSRAREDAASNEAADPATASASDASTGPSGASTGAGAAPSDAAAGAGAAVADGGSGSSPANPLDPALALRISSNRRYLEDGFGKPVLLNHDAAWSMGAYIPDADIAVYFADRASRGFNAAIIELIERQDQGNPNGVNFNGDTPFTGTVSGQPDFTKPREAFWKRVDLILKSAIANKIIPLAFPIYVGAVNGRDGWYQAMLANGSARMVTYAQFLANRYGGLGLIWMVGGDLSPRSTPTPLSDAALSILNKFTHALRSAMPKAIISAHWDRGDKSSDFGDADMHMINGIYTDLITHVATRDAYALPGPIPVYALEHRYANGPATSTDLALRAQSYQVMTSGGAGISYGNEAIWNFDGPWSKLKPWKAHLGDASTGDSQRVYSLFSQRPWFRLAPCNDCVTAGGGAYGSNTYVSVAVTPQGDFMAGYIPDAHTGSVTLSLAKMAGNSRARWWDPRAGKYQDVPGAPFPNQGSRGFSIPGANAAGDRDWLLLLEAL